MHASTRNTRRSSAHARAAYPSTHAMEIASEPPFSLAPKETYHMAKETYHMAKETYHMAKEIASPPSRLHLYAQSPLNPKPHTRRHTLARMAPREASILFSLFSLLSCAYYTLNPNPNP